MYDKKPDELLKGLQRDTFHIFLAQRSHLLKTKSGGMHFIISCYGLMSELSANILFQRSAKNRAREERRYVKKIKEIILQ
jgi:hypothetical protein